jgi:hypothetical protein
VNLFAQNRVPVVAVFACEEAKKAPYTVIEAFMTKVAFEAVFVATAVEVDAIVYAGRFVIGLS